MDHNELAALVFNHIAAGTLPRTAMAAVAAPVAPPVQFTTAAAPALGPGGFQPRGGRLGRQDDDGEPRVEMTCLICRQPMAVRQSTAEGLRREGREPSHKRCRDERGVGGRPGAPRPGGTTAGPRPGGLTPEEQEANRRRLEALAASTAPGAGATPPAGTSGTPATA